MSSEMDKEDDKCPICLIEPVNNPAKPCGCRHIFCKSCLTTWAAQKSECPLCKSQFRRIQSGYDPATKEWQIEETIKTPEPPEWLLRMAPEDINMWPEIWQSDEVDRANRMNALRESLRNQVRRRERQLEATQANSSPQSIRVRRQVYRQQRKYDLTQGNQNRMCSAAFYQDSPAALHRLVPWIKREVIALFGARNLTYVDQVSAAVRDACMNYGIGTQRMREQLRSSFQGYIEPFLHELQGFASSSHYTIDAWDRAAKYKPRSRTRRERERPRLNPENAPFRPNSIQTPTPHRRQNQSSESDVEEVPQPPRNSLNQIRSTPNPQHLIILSSDEDVIGPNAVTPPRPNHQTESSQNSRPLTPNQPSTSRQNSSSSIPISSISNQNSRFTNRYSETGIDPIGDLNPILNPIYLADVPGPSRLPGPDERRRTSLYSRIFDEESRNGRENIDELTASEVYHIARNAFATRSSSGRVTQVRPIPGTPSAPQRRSHIGTLSSSIDHGNRPIRNQQARSRFEFEMVVSDSDDDIVEINPSVPSTAFCSRRRKNDSPAKMNHHVITIDSEESDDDVVESNSNHSVINHPSSSKQIESTNCLSENDSPVTDSEIVSGGLQIMRNRTKTLKRIHPASPSGNSINGQRFKRTIKMSEPSNRHGPLRKRKRRHADLKIEKVFCEQPGPTDQENA